MKDVANMNSLVSYLNPADSKFRLDIPAASPASEFPEDNFSPFAVISDSDALARLMEARLVSDAGSVIKKLFLFIQRDVYDLKKNALWPLNNIDIGKAWENSFAFHAGCRREDMPFVLLSGQRGDQGEMLPFSSLFYCKTMNAYFHPPCPGCGQALTQCEDDRLLNASGLQPFSTSMKRYLFCPACGAPEFYAYEREQGDPSSVKDRRTLIRNFAGLAKAEAASAFPCADCERRAECYGQENHSQERIAPFAFYPFYLLAFEAASLHSTDFIALLSGAGFQEIQLRAEKNRQTGTKASLNAVSRFCAGAGPFLFDHDERHFLEILYLKLAFLEAIVRDFRSGGKWTHPDMKPGIDQIWVTFPEAGGLLPGFWNFKVRIMGIGTKENTQGMSGRLSDDSMTLGLIWLYTLLTNKRQSMADVLSCFKKHSWGAPGAIEQMMKENIFDASNIFWDPQGKNVHDAWQSLWEKSLRMGFALIASTPETTEKLPEELAQLRKHIRENLFVKEIPYATPVPKAVETVLPKTEDEMIHDILLGLIDKLQSANKGLKETTGVNVHEAVTSAVEKPEVSPALPVEEDMEEPVTETVIFSARPAAAGRETLTAHKTQMIVQDMPFREVPVESQETVILSLKDLEPIAKPGAREADLLEETLILSAKPGVKDIPAPLPEKPQKAVRAAPGGSIPIESQETMILSVADLENHKTISTEKTEPMLDETVMISTLTGTPSKAPVQAEIETLRKKSTAQDPLEETMILKPGEKSKDGAKK